MANRRPREPPPGQSFYREHQSSGMTRGGPPPRSWQSDRPPPPHYRDLGRDGGRDGGRDRGRDRGHNGGSHDGSHGSHSGHGPVGGARWRGGPGGPGGPTYPRAHERLLPQHPPPKLSRSDSSRSRKRGPSEIDSMEDGEVRDDFDRGEQQHQHAQPLKRSRMDSDYASRHYSSSSSGSHERNGRGDYRGRGGGGQGRSDHNGDRIRAPSGIPSSMNDRQSGNDNNRQPPRDYRRQQDSRVDNDVRRYKRDRSRGRGRSRDRGGGDRDHGPREQGRRGGRLGHHMGGSSRAVSAPVGRPPPLQHSPPKLVQHSASHDNGSRVHASSAPLPPQPASSKSSSSTSSSSSSSSSSIPRSKSGASNSRANSVAEKTRLKTPFGYRCELANLALKANLAALRSELLVSRIENLDSMVFNVKNGFVANEGVKTEEPVLSDEVKAAIAAAAGPPTTA